MKNFLPLLTLSLTLILSACSSEQTPQPKDAGSMVDAEIVETVGLGESCEEKLCGSGFECSQEKICVETVVLKDLYCPENRDPVCGKKGNFKNGYLNECEAKRHGAEVLYTGFCKPDTSVTGDCDASITRIGYCDTLHSGIEFDGKKCVAKTVTSCDAEIPFQTIEECEEACTGFLKSVFK